MFESLGIAVEDLPAELVAAEARAGGVRST
jgi:hypothetical protein